MSGLTVTMWISVRQNDQWSYGIKLI